jgi:UDP-glucuronate 4-epimerase
MDPVYGDGLKQSPVLVIGSSGFLGSRIAALLLLSGHSVIGLDRSQKIPGELSSIGAQAGGTFMSVAADLCDTARVASVIDASRVTSIVNTAAVLGDSAVSNNLAAAFEINGAAVWRLCALAAARRHIRRVVHVSTRSVYGDYGPTEGPLDEDRPPRNAGPYGSTKMIGELAICTYRREADLDAVAVRVTGLLGPNSPHHGPLLSMIEAAYNAEPFALSAGADYSREYTHVDDAAAAVIVLCQAERTAHAVYNAGAGRQFALATAADVIRELCPGADIDIGPGLPDGEQLRATLSVERIATEFGWHPRPFTDAVRVIIDGMRARERAEGTGMTVSN